MIKFIELSDKIATFVIKTVDDKIEFQRLLDELLTASGGKRNACGQYYWTDEYGEYYPTESGRKIYTKLY